MPARIIFKARYLSGEKSTHIENYIQYMGTRPGVEIFEDDGSLATEKQKQLIEQMIEDFGKEMTESYEYEDYLAKPTKANASAAITACLDAEYGNTATKENYIEYIANRPRVERLGEHGLFSQSDANINLDATASEVAHQGNNVWTNIISLRREDAIETGFDNAAAWRDLLRSKVEAIARNYKIPMRDFVWYAAFHDEGHHPHVHFVCYSKGNEGYLTEKGIENIKSSLAHEIFKQEFSEIYDHQTQLRTNLKDESTQLVEQLARNISDGQYENTELRESIISLADRLDSLPGKKQYGYLPKDVKSLVDAITDELAKHETIATLYDRWYEQKEEILEIYKTKLPPRVPLPENKEFTSVKNMIIREVSGLVLAQEELEATIDSDDISSFDRVVFDSSGEGDSNIEQSPPLDGIQLFDDLDFDISFSDIEKDIQNLYGSDDIDVSDISDISSISDEIEISIPQKGVSHSVSRKSSVNPSVKLYWMGKQFLTEGEELEAIECFKMSAEQGNKYAQYRLGKLYLNGTETIEKDIDQALYWLWRAEAQNNEYAQYTLGNLYLDGEIVEKDQEKSEELLQKSAEQGNPYAAYRYGCLLRDEYEANSEALSWIQKAADRDHPSALYTLCQLNMKDNFAVSFGYLNRLERLDRTENSHIAYYLGKLYLMDENRLKNVSKAISYLQEAAEQDNDMALYALGKVYLAGKDVPVNIPLVISYFEKAAKLKNGYAEYQLGQLFIRGIDVPKDVGRGIWYLNSSAEKDNDMALYALGKLYLAGVDVPQDIDKALDCLQKSADLGNVSAHYQLGKLYLQGTVVLKNIPKALYHLEESARLENDWAMYTLGVLYLKGEDVQKDVGKAIGYLEKAAERGNASAQYQLGKLYFNGEEIPQDVNRGIWYMEQAISNENDAAMFFLGRAYLIGDNVPKSIKKGLELLQAAADRGNEYAVKMNENFNANAAHTAISILHKLSLMIQNNKAVMAAKKPVMPAVDKKELLAILRKKEEQGIRFD